MLQRICSNQTPFYQFLIRQILQCACLSCHTGRFDSKFSHIFKSNTEFELLYQCGPSVNIGVKYATKLCRIMYWSRILPPAPNFIVMLISMTTVFCSKIFSIELILRMDKKYTSKMLSLLNFWNFLGFLKFSILVSKSEIGSHNSTLLCWIFDTHVEAKGQLISRQNWRAVTSSKKWTKHTQDTILSMFCSFFRRSYGTTILSQDLLTFRSASL